MPLQAPALGQGGGGGFAHTAQARGAQTELGVIKAHSQPPTGIRFPERQPGAGLPQARPGSAHLVHPGRLRERRAWHLGSSREDGGCEQRPGLPPLGSPETEPSSDPGPQGRSQAWRVLLPGPPAGRGEGAPPEHGRASRCLLTARMEQSGEGGGGARQQRCVEGRPAAAPHPSVAPGVLGIKSRLLNQPSRSSKMEALPTPAPGPPPSGSGQNRLHSVFQASSCLGELAQRPGTCLPPWHLVGPDIKLRLVSALQSDRETVVSPSAWAGPRAGNTAGLPQ